jgi:hypothetical protein
MWSNTIKQRGVYKIDNDYDPRYSSYKRLQQTEDNDIVIYKDKTPTQQNKTQRISTNRAGANNIINNINKELNKNKTNNNDKDEDKDKYILNNNKLYTAYKSIFNYWHDLILINVIKIKDSSLVSLIKYLIENRGEYELYKYSLNDIYSV